VSASTGTLASARLHGYAAALDVAGLLLLFLQAIYRVPAAEADRRILLLTVAVVPVAFLVFAVMPRRVQFLPENEVPLRSFMVYASLGLPLLVTLLTLLLVAVNDSFDSFAGFALLLAADGGRNLWESVNLRLRARSR
jgi:hypothetical protein